MTPEAEHARVGLTPQPIINRNLGIAATPPKDSKKRTRDALSLRDKTRIIHILQQSGRSRRALARDLSIPRATMHSIWKNKDHILATTTKLPEQSLDLIKRCRPPQYPELEDRVYSFYLFVRSHRKHATKSLIIAKARRLAVQMGITGFGASNGWYTKFLRRRGLPGGLTTRSRCPNANVLTVEQLLQNVRSRLAQFDVHNIYSVLESRFLYRCLPNRSLLSPAVHNSSLLFDQSEPRLAFTISANATGTRIIPPIVVGRDRHPLSFDSAGVDDVVMERYHSHPDECMDAALFGKWLRSWYNIIKTTSDPPWALVVNEGDVMDKLPALEGVTYIRLPYRDGNDLQPMRKGVVERVKSRARAQMLQTLLQILNAQDDFPNAANPLRSGGAGLLHGRKATPFDGVRSLSSGLQDLPGTVVAKSWLQAGILSSDHESILGEFVNRVPSSLACEMTEVRSLFSRLAAIAQERNRAYDFEKEFGKFDLVPTDALDRWMVQINQYEEDLQNAKVSIGDTQEEILLASEAAENEVLANHVQSLPGAGVSIPTPEQVISSTRMQAAHASSATVVKILQAAVNEVSHHSTNHVVLTKLAEALRLATDDRNEKKTRVDTFLAGES